MRDNKTKKHIDEKKIGSEPHAILYWTKKLKITPHELGGAKRATKSTSVVKITKYLERKKREA